MRIYKLRSNLVVLLKNSYVKGILVVLFVLHQNVGSVICKNSKTVSLSEVSSKPKSGNARCLVWLVDIY